MLRLIGAPMWPRPTKPTFMIATPTTFPNGPASALGPPRHRGLVDLCAEAGLVGHGQAAGGVDVQRPGQEEIAPLLGPPGRVIGELEVRTAPDARGDVQVRHQPEPLGPRVRGEPWIAH